MGSDSIMKAKEHNRSGRKMWSRLKQGWVINQYANLMYCLLYCLKMERARQIYPTRFGCTIILARPGKEIVNQRYKLFLVTLEELQIFRDQWEDSVYGKNSINMFFLNGRLSR